MFRRAAPQPAAPEATEAPKPLRRPRPAVKPNDDDAALLAELGIPAAGPGVSEEDEVAALLKALSAADAGDSEEAALMASLESAQDDEADAVLRQLGVRDGVLPAEVMSRRLDPAASMVEVERLEAAVQATKRQAVECKMAGNMDEARAKLRESKALQQALDERMAALDTDGQTEPDLLQELETISTHAGGATQPRAAGQASPSAPLAPPAPPRVADPSPAPPVAGAAAAAPGVTTLREEVRALKREIIALRDAGKTAEAKASMPRLRELERKLAESQG